MLGRRSSERQRGDTLIEVLFAITIFSLVVVTTLALMNQGTSAARRSVEMSLVREQIDAESETLRFLHEAYVSQYIAGTTIDTSGTSTPAKEYGKILAHVKSADLGDATEFGDVTSCPTSTPTGGFLVNPRTATFVTDVSKLVPAAERYAQLAFDPATNANVTAYGIWIEGVRTEDETSPSLTDNAGYVDYYVRACWDAPGQDKPLTMGTIVRLYEPRG